MSEITWGRNPVIEALKAGHFINKILIAQGSHGTAREIAARARECGIPVQIVERRVLDILTGGAGHQGVVAYLSPTRYSSVEEIFETAFSRGEDPLIVILAGWEDPQNFGAIVRTCEAAGVHGVVIPSRRAVPLTGTVAKASAGALEHLPICRVGNLSRAIEDFKGMGVWVVGADPSGRINYFDADLTGPLALVVGGEGKGMGHLAKNCDFLVRIPMLGRVGSLNASVAGSIIVYEILRQRMIKNKASR